MTDFALRIHTNSDRASRDVVQLMDVLQLSLYRARGVTWELERDTRPVPLPDVVLADQAADPLVQVPRSAVVLALQALISEISEREYSAGWYSGIDYLIWKALTSTSRKYVDLSVREATTLLALSGAIAGWVTYEGYVPMAEWVEVVERKNAGGIDA